MRSASSAEQPVGEEGDLCVSRAIAEIYARHFAIHGGGCPRPGTKVPKFHLTFRKTLETCCDTAENLRAWTLECLADLPTGLKVSVWWDEKAKDGKFHLYPAKVMEVLGNEVKIRWDDPEGFCDTQVVPRKHVVVP